MANKQSSSTTGGLWGGPEDAFDVLGEKLRLMETALCGLSSEGYPHKIDQDTIVPLHALAGEMRELYDTAKRERSGQ